MKGITCDEFEVNLERRAAGALPPDEAEATHLHVQGCARCLEYQRVVQVSLQGLRDAARVPWADQRVGLEHDFRQRLRPLRMGVWGVVLNLFGLAGLVLLAPAGGLVAVLSVCGLTVSAAGISWAVRERQELARLVALASTQGELLLAHRAHLTRVVKEVHQGGTATLGLAALGAFAVPAFSSSARMLAAGLLITMSTAGFGLLTRFSVEPRLRRELDDLEAGR